MEPSRDSRKRFRDTGIAAFVLLAVIFLGSPVAPYVRNLFVYLSVPRPTTSAYALLSRDALISRLTDAEKKLSLIRYQSVLYGLLSDENTKLRQTFNAAPPPKSILARVIARPPKTVYDTLLIDQGAAAGISGNDFAIYDGIALGKVVSEGQSSATVQLFSSPGSDEDVLLGKPQSIAVAHGVGGGAFELSVPQGVAVSVGDPVRIEATQSLLMGVVAGVSSKPTDSLQAVIVRSPVSFADLDFIEIIPNQRP